MSSGTDGLLSYLSDLRSGSVVVFFVLSGYLVGGSLLRKRGDLDWRSYFCARASRIYTVLLPAFVFTSLVDGLLISTRGSPSIYTSVWRSGVLGADALLGRFDVANALSSLLCLEPIFGRPLGSNGALWSLGYEWMFYLSFPLVVLLGHRLRPRSGPYIVGAAVLPVLFILHLRWMTIFSGIWMLGACAEQISQRNRLPLGISRCAGLGTVISLLISPLLDVRLATCLIGFTLAVFLARRDPREASSVSTLDRRLAAFSYSLYLTHLTTAVAIGELAVRLGYLGADGLTFGLRAAMLISVIAIAALLVSQAFYWAFERKTEMVRQAMFGMLGGRPSLQIARSS